MSEREANIRRDWADCVGADPDQLDQWAVDQICDLQDEIERLRQSLVLAKEQTYCQICGKMLAEAPREVNDESCQ